MAFLLSMDLTSEYFLTPPFSTALLVAQNWQVKWYVFSNLALEGKPHHRDVIHENELLMCPMLVEC